MIYWYESVAISLATCGIIYFVQVKLCNGDDLLMFFIKYYNSKKEQK